MPAGPWNVTQASLSNSIGVEGMLMTIGFIIMMIGALMLAFYSAEYLAKAIAILSKVFGSVKYVIYGLVTSVLVWILYIVVDSLRVAGSGFVTPEMVGYGIGAYIVFYAIGRVAEYAVTRMAKTYGDYSSSHAQVIQKEPATTPPEGGIS